MTFVDMSCATLRMMIRYLYQRATDLYAMSCRNQFGFRIEVILESLDHDLDLPHWVRAFRKQNRDEWMFEREMDGQRMRLWTRKQSKK